MSKYGYLEVFQRVPLTSRYRESTVIRSYILFKMKVPWDKSVRENENPCTCISFADKS